MSPHPEHRPECVRPGCALDPAHPEHRPFELCRRCGVRLDRVLIEQGWDLHPVCNREPAHDQAMDRALYIVKAAFPGATVIEEETA